MYPSLWGGFPWFNVYEDRQGVYCSCCCGIRGSSHRTCKCGTKPFFWWVRAQGRSTHEPGMAKNTSGPVGIPLIRGTRQYSPKGVKAWGTTPWGRRKFPDAETHSARSEVRPNNWRRAVLLQLPLALLALFLINIPFG